MGLNPGLGRSLKEEMVTHFSILAKKLPRLESLSGYSLWGGKELDMTEQLSACVHTHTETVITANFQIAVKPSIQSSLFNLF